MSPTVKKILGWLATVLVASLPALGSYLQGRAEVKARTGHMDHKSATSYSELVQSVEALQETMVEQHDTLVALRAQIDLLERQQLAEGWGTPASQPTKRPKGLGVTVMAPPANKAGDVAAMPEPPSPKFMQLKSWDAL